MHAHAMDPVGTLLIALAALVVLNLAAPHLGSDPRRRRARPRDVRAGTSAGNRLQAAAQPVEVVGGGSPHLWRDHRFEEAIAERQAEPN
jgi:hypothetical protein